MIKPVPQTYAGVRFRSTLEADWAATLDARGIAWSYEPEAVELPSGELYRPDFWLPGLEAWLEVKGPGVPGVEKAYALGAAGHTVVIGGPPIRGAADWQIVDYISPATHIRLLEALGRPGTAAMARAPRA